MNAMDKQQNIEAIKRIDYKIMEFRIKKSAEQLVAAVLGLVVISVAVCCKYIDYICGLIL